MSTSPSGNGRGLSRRDFIAGAAAGAGAGAIALLASGAGWKFVPEEYPGKGKLPLYDMVLPTTCAECGDGCGLICFVKGGRLMAVQGNPEHPGNRGSICLKAFAGINQIYDPERILTPMRRKAGSARGAGELEPISWDEALKILFERIGASSGSLRGMFFEDGSFERTAGFVDRFLDAAGVGMVARRREVEDANLLAARRAAFGLSNGFPDAASARYIVNFGADPLESGRFFLVLAKRMVETLIERRAKLVTFDPRLSNTAACSTEWFPLAPGSEGLVALAIAGELVRSGRYDRAFVERHTDCSHSELLKHLEPYTPEEAQKRGCGAPAKVLRRVAYEMADNAPCIALAGTGPANHERGFENVRCVDLLNVILGSVDVAGGLDLFPDEKSWFAPVEPVPNPVQRGAPANLLQALDTPGTVQAYFSYMGNPAYSAPDAGRMASCLADERRLPFVAVMDTHLTETALLADLFLPAATPFESWGVQPGFQTLSIRRPAAGFLGEMPALRLSKARGEKFARVRRFCKPLGESRTLPEVLVSVASAMGEGVSKFTDFPDLEAWLGARCKAGGLFGPGGFTELCDRGFANLPPPGNLRRDGFPTPSKRIELRPGDRGLPASDWKPAVAEQGRLVLLPYVPSTSSPVSSNAKWLYEVIHENPLWVNASTAADLKIRTGDRVRVTSKAGSFEAEVRVTQGIFPGAAAIARGFGHTACGRIARAQPFESADPDTALLWWRKSGPGVNASVVVEARVDPSGGGFAWNDTEITVEKIG